MAGRDPGAVLVGRGPRHRAGGGVPTEPLGVLRMREELLDEGPRLETLRHPRHLMPRLEIALERRGIGCAAGHRSWRNASAKQLGGTGELRGPTRLMPRRLLQRLVHRLKRPRPAAA